MELAKLQQKFSENVLDATAAFSLHLTDPGPAGGNSRGRPFPVQGGCLGTGSLEGWLLTLDFPSFEPVMKYARDRSLREELHGAYVGRCRGDEFDNLPLLPPILALRHEMAEILGHRNFPDYRLEDAMAKSGEKAVAFEEDLVYADQPLLGTGPDRAASPAGTRGNRGVGALGRRLRSRIPPERTLRHRRRDSAALSSR